MPPYDSVASAQGVDRGGHRTACFRITRCRVPGCWKTSAADKWIYDTFADKPDILCPARARGRRPIPASSHWRWPIACFHLPAVCSGQASVSAGITHFARRRWRWHQHPPSRRRWYRGPFSLLQESSFAAASVYLGSDAVGRRASSSACAVLLHWGIVARPIVSLASLPWVIASTVRISIRGSSTSHGAIGPGSSAAP
jgi:hypothetical protein